MSYNREVCSGRDSHLTCALGSMGPRGPWHCSADISSVMLMLHITWPRYKDGMTSERVDAQGIQNVIAALQKNLQRPVSAFLGPTNGQFCPTIAFALKAGRADSVLI